MRYDPHDNCSGCGLAFWAHPPMGCGHCTFRPDGRQPCSVCGVARVQHNRIAGAPAGHEYRPLRRALVTL